MVKLEISVTAEIDEKVIAPATILGALSAGPLDEIISNKGHDWRLAGRSEEQTETLMDMKIGTIIGLILIYIIFIWSFLILF